MGLLIDCIKGMYRYLKIIAVAALHGVSRILNALKNWSQQTGGFQYMSIWSRGMKTVLFYGDLKWSKGLKVIPVTWSSWNDFSSNSNSIEPAYQQALKYTSEGPFYSKSFKPSRNHYEHHHSRKAVCFCVYEQHSSCMWPNLVGISLFIPRIHKHCRFFGIRNK